MFDKLFLEHPRSLGLSYDLHRRNAFKFGWRLTVAGLGTMIHAFVPGWFPEVGGRAVRDSQTPPPAAPPLSGDPTTTAGAL